MNIQEYISSGIIESYVLGLASPEEQKEFEQLCTQYPELIEARHNFELALEKQAMDNAITPPDECRENIWAAIGEQTSKVIPMEGRSSKRFSLLKWAVAASFLLFLTAGYMAYKFYRQNDQLKKEISESQDLQARLNERLKKMEDMEKMMNDPAVTVVSLKPMQKNPVSANIYWDTTSSNVYLVIKNMPRLPSEKQYQLWSLIDGKPNDLGLFDGGERVILKMNNAQKADAFAITVENRGNTGGPKGQLEAMSKTKL